MLSCFRYQKEQRINNCLFLFAWTHIQKIKTIVPSLLDKPGEERTNRRHCGTLRVSIRTNILNFRRENFSSLRQLHGKLQWRIKELAHARSFAKIVFLGAQNSSSPLKTEKEAEQETTWLNCELMSVQKRSVPESEKQTNTSQELQGHCHSAQKCQQKTKIWAQIEIGQTYTKLQERAN